jgi:twitching motility protein PilT
VFRIDSEIQTGKKFGMILLDENLWNLYRAGKISQEEAIDKSKNPGGMVDKMQRAGIQVGKQDDGLLAEAADAQSAGGASSGGTASGGASDADKQAQLAANRARMMAMQGKK